MYEKKIDKKNPNEENIPLKETEIKCPHLKAL